MFELFAGLLPGIFKLGDQLIEDKDKRNEYAFKALEMQHEMALRILDKPSYPWIDGLVKLSYASESIVKGLFRPIASVGALGFVCYCAYQGIQLDPMLEGILASLAPAWGVSRYKEKMASTKAKEIATSGDVGW
jgi:hypothetical protein